jgi:hypothetical protein
MGNLELAAVNLVGESQTAILLRRDFDERLDASPAQVTRVIRKLIEKGTLLRVSLGMYVKAERSVFTGRTVPVLTLPDLAREGLKRLNIETVPSSAERTYNEGRSQQVPTGRTIGVLKDVKRQIGYNNVYVRYERVRA